MSARRRRRDELEWTLRGRVFQAIAFVLLVAFLYWLAASGIAADIGRWVGHMWAEQLLRHTPAP